MDDTDILLAVRDEQRQGAEARRTVGRHLLRAIDEAPEECRDPVEVAHQYAVDHGMNSQDVLDAWDAIKVDPKLEEDEKRLLSRVR